MEPSPGWYERTVVLWAFVWLFGVIFTTRSPNEAWLALVGAIFVFPVLVRALVMPPRH